MNKIKSFYLLLSVFLLLPAVEAIAAEEQSDITVVVSGAINYKKLEFKITDVSFEPKLLTFDLAFTGAYKSFYATINYDQTIKDDYIYDYEAAGQDDTIMLMSREDSGLTLGYSFENSLSIFGGYLDGTTTALRPANYGGILPADSDRFNGAFYFGMAGPFIGVGYATPFGQKATLSLNIAYADMDGDLLFDNGSFKEKIEGDSAGFSYGISLSGPLAESMAYRIGIKVNRYEFDDTDYVPAPGRDDFTHDQNFSMFYVGVSNYF